MKYRIFCVITIALLCAFTAGGQLRKNISEKHVATLDTLTSFSESLVENPRATGISYIIRSSNETMAAARGARV